MPSPLDYKAVATIAILLDRQHTWSVMTYGDLAKRLAHAQQGLSGILDRVGTWCFSVHKQSLAMLVIGEQGGPNEGMYRQFPEDTDPVTPENYERRRVQLWREDWASVAVPTAEEVAAAYARYRAPG